METKNSSVSLFMARTIHMASTYQNTFKEVRSTGTKKEWKISVAINYRS